MFPEMCSAFIYLHFRLLKAKFSVKDEKEKKQHEKSIKLLKKKLREKFHFAILTEKSDQIGISTKSSSVIF